MDAIMDAARTPPDAGPLSLADAAVRLGISPDAARKRLERGTLRGEKRDGRWLVYLHPDAAASTVQDVDRTPVDTVVSRDRPPDATADAGAVQVLRELLAEERRTSDALRDAATMWQGRAGQLEERLKALGAGPIAGDVAQDAIPGPVRGAVAAEAAEANAIALTPQEGALRRWWRRLVGG